MKPVRRIVLASAAALAVAVVSGCGVQAGSAAVVGSTRISDSDVAAMVDELKQTIAADPTALFDSTKATAANVQRLTRHYLLDEAAAREGVVVTQAQVDQLISSTTTSTFGGDSTKFEQALASQYAVPPSQIPSFAHDVLESQALTAKLAPGADATTQQNKLNAYLAPLGQELGVEVSPRYGTWSFDTSTLAATPDDLSFVPSATPSAEPGSPSASPSPSAS